MTTKAPGRHYRKGISLRELFKRFPDDATASVSEYVWGQVHTNGIEGFWGMLRRAHRGAFHKIRA